MLEIWHAITRKLLSHQQRAWHAELQYLVLANIYNRKVCNGY